MAALFEMLFGSCKPEHVDCCSSRDEGEMLTAAWRDARDRVHAEAEVAAPSPPVPAAQAGSAPWPSEGMPEAIQLPQALPLSTSARGFSDRQGSAGGTAPASLASSAASDTGASPVDSGVSGTGGTGECLQIPSQPVLGARPPIGEQQGVRSGLAAAATATRKGPPMLQVPNEFDGVSLDCSQTPVSAEQRRLLQASLRIFTRSLLRGVCMNVLLDDGRTLFAEASLDTELTHLVLHMPNIQCPVALKCIESICAPEDVMADSVVASNQAFLDDRCTTLVIRDGQFLTFVFDTPRTREYFETCLKIIIMAKGEKGEKGRPGNASNLGRDSQALNAGSVEGSSSVTPEACPGGTGQALGPLPEVDETEVGVGQPLLPSHAE